MGEAEEHLSRTLKRALGNPSGVSQEVIAELLDGRVRPGLELPENRGSGRLGVALEARLRPGFGPKSPALVTDVSLSGLHAELDGRPPGPGPVLVELCLDSPETCYLLAGRISWARGAARGARAGVELVSEYSHAWFAALSHIVAAVAGSRRKRQ